MNTSQMYGGKGNSTPKAEQLTTQVISANVDSPAILAPCQPTQTQRQMSARLDWLYYEDYLTDEQRPWSVIIPVKSEGMSPTIAVGEDIVGVLLDPSEYATATGIVAVKLKDSPDTYQIGRVAMGNRGSICLTQDNATHTLVTLRRRDIRQVYQILWILATDVE